MSQEHKYIQETAAKIFENTQIGEGAILEFGVIIGRPPHSKKEGELKTIIGLSAYIRAYTYIYAGVEIGDNFQTGPSVLIRENNQIGNNVVVWHNATLNPGNKIGNGSRIHVGCFLEDVTLGENVFLGPNVTFTNDPHPVMPANFRECWGGATVEEGAIIGAGTTILPHVKIGKHAVIGAGSVVVDDVPAYKVVVGNPARIIKDIEEVNCTRQGTSHHPYSGLRKK